MRTLDLLNKVVKLGFNREKALADIDASLDDVIGADNRKPLAEEEISEELANDILFGFKCEIEQEEKEYDFFDGNDWKKVSASWLEGVELEGLKAVYDDVRNHIKCVYKDGREVYYENVYGTWGFPVEFK